MHDDALKRSALIAATFGSFITPFTASSINVALPAIQKEFHMGAVLLSWIPTAFLVAAGISLLPFGRLADIYGRKRIFTLGIGVFTASSFLLGISVSAPMLLVFRFLQGVGSAMIFATGMAILTSVFPPSERGRAIGIQVAVVYMGLSLGPFVGGILTHHLTWRSIFVFNVPFGLFVIYVVRRKLIGEWAEAKGESFDYLGSLIYAAAVVMGMCAVLLLPDLKSIWLILMGLLCIAAFVKWEMRVSHPVFEVSLFRANRVFALSSLAALINYSATFAVSFLMSLYLQYTKGLSAQSAGLVLIAQPVMMALFSPLAGRLSDRVEPRIVASLGMALTAIGLSFLAFLDPGTSIESVVGCLVLLGSGFALFSSPNMSAIMGSVEKKYYGIASGSVGTMRILGQMVSMSIATLVFALYLGSVQITPEYLPNFMQAVRSAFVVFAFLCFAGVLPSLARGNLLERQ